MGLRREIGWGRKKGLGREMADALFMGVTHTVEDWTAHRQTDTQTHKSENSTSASFTPYTWRI